LLLNKMHEVRWEASGINTTYTKQTFRQLTGNSAQAGQIATAIPVLQ
jgi:hypothetical protein